ncbi:MAG: M15 family metallopeptidase [Mesorhizobium sp.]
MAGEFDWTPYAVGGATRPDSFSGMNPDFASALQQLFTAAPADIQGNLRVGSGFRSPDRQAQLWDQALQKYGSPEAARKWVAPPGNSQHNHGHAADLKFLNDEARKWVHANAGTYGLAFPMAHENWHVELAALNRQNPYQAARPK